MKTWVDEPDTYLGETYKAYKLEKTACLPWLFLGGLIKEGDRVVDATAGKGRDTLTLARMVGPRGRVDAFDIQEEALVLSRDLLSLHGMAERVCWRLLDHARIPEVVAPGIRAAVFNLGYLPGSDHRIVTRPVSTRRAVEGVLDLLCPGGAVVITVYPGHGGGRDEGRSLRAFLAGLSPQNYCVVEGTYLNHDERAPYWLMIQRKGRGSA